MYIALDLGLKHVGIAISKSYVIATPYKNLYIVNDLYDELLAELKKLNQQDLIKKVFIGLPLHLDGNESELSLFFREIKIKLENNFTHCQFILVDERLTSKSAYKKKTINQRNDSLVAAEILNYQLFKNRGLK